MKNLEDFMDNMNGCIGQKSRNGINQEFDETTKLRLWNPKGFLIISILFSFLPAAILYSLNYGRLGHYKKRNLSLVISVTGFIVMLSMAFVIEQGIIKSIFYGLNAGVALFMKNDQSIMFESHIKNGGGKASYLIPGILSIVITAVFLGLIIYSSNIPDQKLMFRGNELYYTERVQKGEVEKLGEYLSEQGFFSEDRKVSVKIDKRSTTYKFSLIIDKSHIEDKELEQFAKDIGQELSYNVFDNSNVDIIFCNDVFKPLKTISE
jgi:hypothetical protein